jgi:hypothetical protein
MAAECEQIDEEDGSGDHPGEIQREEHVEQRVSGRADSVISRRGRAA